MVSSSHTTTGVESNSQLMGLFHHDPIQAIQPYIGQKLISNNWSAFEFGFVAHLIKYGLKEVLNNYATGRAKNNKIYSILIAAMELSHFLLVNKISILAHAWLALKSFYWKRGG